MKIEELYNKSINAKFLSNNPEKGLVIAFKYEDEDGNTNDIYHLGQIRNWENSVFDNTATLFYMDACMYINKDSYDEYKDVAVFYKGKGDNLYSYGECFIEFDTERMLDIRIATPEEVCLLNETLRLARESEFTNEYNDSLRSLKVVYGDNPIDMESDMESLLEKKVMDDVNNILDETGLTMAELKEIVFKNDKC